MARITRTRIACDWPTCAERTVLPRRHQAAEQLRRRRWHTVRGRPDLHFCPAEIDRLGAHLPLVDHSPHAWQELLVACGCGWSTQRLPHRRAEHEPVVRSPRAAYRLWADHVLAAQPEPTSEQPRAADHATVSQSG